MLLALQLNLSLEKLRDVGQHDTMGWQLLNLHIPIIIFASYYDHYI
jgi:hypothetical protein